MVTLTFDGSTDPTGEVRALAVILGMWLREAGPPTEPVHGAEAHLEYTDGGDLKSVTVTLGEQ